MRKISCTSLILFFLSLTGCKKPGYGGDAKIVGCVHVQKWNATFTQYIGEYPGKDLYVYIIYGSHAGFDKRIKTDYNGQFEFPYLYEGDYSIYVYSRDSSFTDPSGSIAVVKQINITEKNQVFNADTFHIFE